MDAETWLTGDDAKALGWDHEITDPLAVSASVDKGKLERVPAEAAKWLVVATPGTVVPHKEEKPDGTATPEPAAASGTAAVVTPPTADALAVTDAAYAQGEEAGFAAGRADAGAALVTAEASLVDLIAKLAFADAAIVTAKANHAAALTAAGEVAAKALADANTAAALALKTAEDKAASDMVTAKAEAAAALAAVTAAHAVTAAKLEKLSGGLLAPPLNAGPGDWKSVMAEAEKRLGSYNAALAECSEKYPEMHREFIAAANKKRTRK
jgi:hypothetical protein